MRKLIAFAIVFGLFPMQAWMDGSTPYEGLSGNPPEVAIGSNSSGRWTMESSAIRVEIDARAGGKIRSFYDRQHNREYFFQDPRPHLPAMTNDYMAHDMSGMDECFPTVGACNYPEGERRNLPLGDHGRLWQGPWKAEPRQDRLIMSRDLPDLMCSVRRTARLETSTTLWLDYVIHNDGHEPLKFIYAGHILPFAVPGSRLILPDGLKKMYVAWTMNHARLKAGTWINGSPAGTNWGNPLSLTPHSGVKLISEKLSDGWMEIVPPETNAPSLRIEFDTKSLPYLSLLICQGCDFLNDGIFKNIIFVAMEPTNAMGDILDTAKAPATLPAGTEARFWIRLRLFAANENPTP